MGTYVQGTTSFSGATNVSAPSLTLNVTAGDLIILAVGWNGNPGATSSFLTCNQAVTWSESAAWGPNGVGNYIMNVFFTTAAATGTFTVTMNISAATNFVRMLLHEYRGYAAFDVGHIGVNFSGSTATDTITTTSAHDLIFAWCVDNNGVTSYGAPMALRLTAGSESTGDNLDGGAAGAVTVTCHTAGGGGGLTVVSFKTTGPGTPTGSVAMTGVSGLSTGSVVTERASIIEPATASLTITGNVATPPATVMSGVARLNVTAATLIHPASVTFASSTGMVVVGTTPTTGPVVGAPDLTSRFFGGAATQDFFSAPLFRDVAGVTPPPIIPTGPSFYFTPPVVYINPPFIPDTPISPALSLFRHYTLRAVGVDVFLLSNGGYCQSYETPENSNTNIPYPWNPNDPGGPYARVYDFRGHETDFRLDPYIVKVYYGGSTHPITSDEASALEAAGYAAYVTEGV
jgi:hypothetical protein